MYGLKDQFLDSGGAAASLLFEQSLQVGSVKCTQILALPPYIRFPKALANKKTILTAADGIFVRETYVRGRATTKYAGKQS